MRQDEHRRHGDQRHRETRERPPRGLALQLRAIAAPVSALQQAENRGKSQRTEIERGSRLREIGEHGQHAGERAPRASIRARRAVPGCDDEGGHQRFHDRGAVVHHVDVVGREQAAGHQAGEIAGDPSDAEAEQEHGHDARDLGDQTRLANADAEQLEREDSRPVNTGAMKSGFHSSMSPRAEQRLVARVVHPRALVVPHHADARPPGRISGREDAAQRGREHDHEHERPRDAPGQAGLPGPRGFEIGFGSGCRDGHGEPESQRIIGPVWLETPDGPPTADLTMVIPTYNERERIGELVETLCAVCVSEGVALELVVVDDNSPDGTGALVDELARRGACA